MANYVENRDTSITKVKGSMKQEVMDYIEQCLIDRYGDENCGYVRNGSGDSKTKELAVRIGNIEYNRRQYRGLVE